MESGAVTRALKVAGTERWAGPKRQGSGFPWGVLCGQERGVDNVYLTPSSFNALELMVGQRIKSTRKVLGNELPHPPTSVTELADGSA
jgi:hypothetical protein